MLQSSDGLNNLYLFKGLPCLIRSPVLPDQRRLFPMCRDNPTAEVVGGPCGPSRRLCDQVAFWFTGKKPMGPLLILCHFQESVP